MTIDEAIKICEEDAEKIGGNPQSDRHAEQCKQFAEWLTELEELREMYREVVMEGEILNADYTEQVALNEQYKKREEQYKRLLKAAVEDFAVYGALKDLSAEQRVQNPDWRRFNRVFDILDHRWRYTDEALKLIGKGGDV